MLIGRPLHPRSNCTLAERETGCEIGQSHKRDEREHNLNSQATTVGRPDSLPIAAAKQEFAYHDP